MFQIRFPVLILTAVLAVTVLGTSGVLVNADPADYKIEAQELDGTWTPGMVTGYLECNNVPVRLSATYRKNEGETYQINLGALYLDTSTPKNKGVDYFVDFTYADPDGALSGTPTVTEQANVHNLPWAGGSGTGDTAVQPNGVTQLRYNLTFTVNNWSNNVQKTVTFYWKAHLALSPHGAFFWTGPPVANLQVFADPPSGGTKTVNIRRPEMVSVTKKVEAQHFMGYDWTLEKSATPASLSLTPGQTGTVTYTITVQRDPLDVYRMRGNITIKNLYADLSVCVDVLDQVQSTNTEDPDGYIDNARWTWDDQSIPAASQLVLYFPGPTSSEWFDFPPGSVTEETTYYNIVWVGLMADLGCPTVSAATADWTTDYDRVVSNYTSFTFTRVEDGVNTIVVDDHETLSGPIELVSVTYDPVSYPWTVSDDATLQLSKTVRCTGNGIGIITDHAEARDPESEELITESNEVTVYVYQLTSPSISTSLSALEVPVGTPVNDTATLQGVTSDATGNIVFKVFSGSDTTCSGAVLFTSNPITVSGPDTYGPSQPNFIPSSVGTYRWQAFYSGDSKNNPATSACDAEILTVKAAPSIRTVPSASVITLGESVWDSAILSGVTADLGDTVTYKLYDDPSCGGIPVFSSTKTVVTSGVLPDSDPFTPLAVGHYEWQAVYIGATITLTSECGSEPVEVRSGQPPKPPVGGELYEPNKLVFLKPYLTLLGLVAAIAAAVAIARGRRP